MEFDFSEYTAEQLEERRTAIIAETATATGEALDRLDAESRALNAEREARAAEAARQETRRAVAEGRGNTVKTFKEETRMPDYIAATPEYRTAWLKDIAVRDGKPIFGEMTKEERDAFTHTTANSGAVVPAETLNRIIELVDSMAPIYADAVKSGFTKGFTIPRHTAITAGDATGVTEGTANDDEANSWDLLPFDGVEIKKHVVITRKMQFKSIDAFEAWLVNELAKRIAVAKEKLLLARMDGTAPAGGSAVPAAAIASTNVKPNVAKTDAGIRGLMALLHGAGNKTVYANSATIWGVIAGIENANGQKLFIPDTMGDPMTAGRVYGAVVKEDANLADNVIYIVVNGHLLANDFDDLFIFSAIEPKTANTITTAYSLFDGALDDPKAAVKATFAA